MSFIYNFKWHLVTTSDYFCLQPYIQKVLCIIEWCTGIYWLQRRHFASHQKVRNLIAFITMHLRDIHSELCHVKKSKNSYQPPSWTLIFHLSIDFSVGRSARMFVAKLEADQFIEKSTICASFEFISFNNKFFKFFICIWREYIS